MNTENNTVVTAPQQEPSHQEPVQNNQTFPLPPQYQPKPLFELSKGDNAFGICAIIAGIFTSLFGIFGGFALGYLLSLVFLLTLFTVYFIKLGKADIFPIVCGLLSLATGAIFLCTTNISVRFLGVIVGFLLALMCFDGLSKGKAKGNRQSLGVFYSAASTAGNIGAAIKSLFSNSKGEKRAFGKVLMGLLCAIPVLAVVLPLLLSSDDAFRGMMSNLFDNTFTTLLKIVFGVGMGLFVITYGFSLKTGRVTKLKSGKFAGIENVYVISFLSAIAVCYLLYLFSQLAYFFSAFQGFLPDREITYAQYARKGFFEMCIIAVINLAIVFSALLFAKKKGGKVCHGIKPLLPLLPPLLW
ncbi:MAG: DUF4173 domain-containing protein [Clostridia bacterium]|nr:DUF4173 domain-containing protein [Clostridia bacterium]